MEFPPGSQLTIEGESPTLVYALTQGSARVEVNGRCLNTIQAGEFIGRAVALCSLPALL
jgi:hypothetical protein